MEDTIAHAESKKAEGNKAFAKKKYQVANESYSEAIALDSSNHVYYSNRSACYAETGKFGEAKADGEMCIKLKPGFVKGYLRKVSFFAFCF
jgi:tetratricopeptide (TPR) repeat protein